jgi:hypothetical protein
VLTAVHEAARAVARATPVDAWDGVIAPSLALLEAA